ncbi:DUF421 domain-containing protein [Paenibacillus endoradicis]|uniref:DUF421 domain-containing protein n=1 Tax=Paenibacillus endoradicis TaxID=2972487 RepID=UPI002159248A|nr:DUF421 domain-containing protein [Paenibacillus endoradicis]MCR8657042.1 DUF421 domain-containing protein [Paenibacillus endoradicis]
MNDVFELTYRTLIALLVMFILTKMLGKRQLSEISLFGYISGISIGNIAAYIAMEDDKLWSLGIIALIIWVGITMLLEYWTLKSKKTRSVVDGNRRTLIANGIVLKDALHKERYTVEELLQRLRNKDVYKLSDVESASIEANGDISVFLKQDFNPLTPNMLGMTIEPEKEPITLIVDGSMDLETMRSNGISEVWLKKQLDTVNLKYEDVFIAQYTIDQSLSLFTLDKRAIEVNLQSEQLAEQTKLEDIKRGLLQTIAYLEQQAKKKQG